MQIPGGHLVHDEIIPIVPPAPDTDLKDCYRLIDRRFANPEIGDTISRLCFDGSNRQPKVGLDPSLFGTHSLRRTKATLI